MNQTPNADIASVYELDKVMGLGVTGDRISYGNTIKKAKDIRTFYEKGVRLYATDSEADLRNIAKAAPGSKVYVRIDRKSTRLNSSHVRISYAVFCLKKK